MEQSFDELCKQESVVPHSKSKILAVSLAKAVKGSNFKTTDFFNMTSPPSANIGEILLFLKSKHKNGKIHFLIDEMVADIFVSSYSKELNQSLQGELSQSKVAIVLQSIRRKKEINDKIDGYRSSSQEIDLESTGMEKFHLSKTMRLILQRFQLMQN